MTAKHNKEHCDPIVDENGVESEDTGGREDDNLLLETDLRLENREPTIGQLIERMQQNEIDLSPDFQRNSGLWKVGAKSRLIESILLQIPLPTFYFDATDDNKWVVIDGLQRLTALRDYILSPDDISLEDKETEEKIKKSITPFALVDLEFLKKCNGKSFGELERRYQRRIKETQVTTSKLAEGTDEKVKFSIFRRINTGGLPLSPQEIRHALNQGPVTHFLKELAQLEEFKNAPWKPKTPNPDRMEEREYILRFLAFRHRGVEEYNPTLDDFLNETMKILNGLNEVSRNELKNSFVTALNRATELFGKSAFNRPGARINSFNTALFETWTVALANLDQKNWEKLFLKKEKLMENYSKKLEIKEYSNSFSIGTGQRGRVQTRFQAIEDIIQETIND